MIKIAFFGQDVADAAVKRRVQSFFDDGITVTGFMMRRLDTVSPEWHNVDLGRTYDEAYLQRIMALVVACTKILCRHRQQFRNCNLVYARNLDMLICAFICRMILRPRIPVIYECLDINKLMTNTTWAGNALRWIERCLLKRCKLLVTSSPGFLHHYFERYHRGHYDAYILENRMTAGAAIDQRPTQSLSHIDEPLYLGWFGSFRCNRSLNMLLKVAETFQERICIKLYGKPTRSQIRDFEERISGHSNVYYGGSYSSPKDLKRIYAEVDIVWAGDFKDACSNSAWLLPNRLYEGGFYLTPGIASAKTQTADWIVAHNCGFVVDEPVEIEFTRLLNTLIEDRTMITTYQSSLADLGNEVFVQPPGEMAAIVNSAIRQAV